MPTEQERKRLKRQADAILRRAGFVDAEHDVDFNGWTFGRPGRGALVSYVAASYGAVPPARAGLFVEANEAEAWRLIGRAVHDLGRHPHRRMLISWSDTGNLNAAARAHGVAYATAHRVVARFCQGAGIPMPQVSTKVEAQRRRRAS